MKRRAFWLAVLVAAALAAGFATPVQAAPAPTPGPAAEPTLQRPGHSPSPASLKTANALPNGLPLFALTCPTTAVCVAVGFGGEVITTADGGTTWTPRNSGVSTNINGVKCPSVSNCVAVGDYGLALRSTDGGITWTTSATLNNGSYLADVSCPSVTICYAVGYGPSIFKTSDGGLSWSVLNSNVFHSLLNVSCASTVACTAVGFAGTITATSDGTNWAAQGSGVTALLTSVSCSPFFCHAVGFGGTILALLPAPGIQTWTKEPSNTTADLQGVSCTSWAYCVAVGNSGAADVLDSPLGNYGTWVPVALPTRHDMFAPVCSTTLTCLVVGDFGTIVRTTTGASGWARRAYGPPATLYGVSCPGALTVCFAAGGYGILEKSADQGSTWTGLPSRTAIDLRSISCATTTMCVAVGGNGVIESTADGGATWQLTNSPAGLYLWGVSCPSTSVCFAVGASGNISASTDGGATWATQSSGTSNRLIAVACTNTSACIAVGDFGTVVSTTNGGSSWSTQTSGVSSSLAAIACPSSTTCFAFAPNNPLIKTVNSGATWTTQNTGSNAQWMGVGCSSTTTCTAVSIEGWSTSTTDGATWTPQAVGVSLYGISCPVSDCLAVGTNGAIAKLSGGHWTLLAGTINAISCPTTLACMAVGDGGLAMTTTDGGSTWTHRLTGTLFSLTSVSCPAVSTCFVAAGYGVLATTDGGSTWSNSTLGSVTLNAISCSSTTACVIVGWGGNAWVTSDGGTSWTGHPIGGGVVRGIHCIAGTSTCVAVGEGLNGITTSSTDGGVTWASPTQVSNVLFGINCTSASSCLAVGANGTILSTVDGGSTWTSLSSGVTQQLNGVSCATTATCFVVGPSGFALRTVKGGSAWTPQLLGAAETMHAISCPTALICYAVGDHGFIASTTTGGAGGWTLLAPPTCTSATLTSNVAPPQPGGTVVTFTASATGPQCTNPVYQYWMWSASSGWVLKQAYSSNAQFVLDTTGWTPGTYTVDVWAEETGSPLGTNNYETFGLEAWVVGGCDSATLTPNPAPTTGTVIFTAAAAGIGCNHPQYQWWLWSPATGWVLKQPYSSTATWSLDVTGLPPATYTVDVWVKQKDSPLTYETWALSSVPKGACGATTVSATQSSPQSVGGVINLSTASPGCTTPSFRYWIYPGQNAAWQMLRDYSTTGTYDWNTTTGYKPGTQSLVVHVRQAGSTAAYDTDGLVSFSLTGCSYATLAATPGSPQAIGTPVALTASAPGCSTPLFQFWYYLPGTGWVMLRDYGLNATYSWDTTGIPPGTYAWVVFVKQQGSANDHDSYALFSNSVG